ncbi:DNA primase [Candidatus Saccharibacteria bacterium RIFCSPHIGHO2_12_FULL_47_16b]|nr:MAG: DNA primase [Candidatus Saccharibacteria bacterium RIFCSPHIGHO2_12_FULL_47_16b]
MDAVQEIKARLNIEDVIGEYVQLKRSGRNFKGLSPWTNEKTPSFMVSPEKQIWHDFSSGKGGDMISFVMEMEGLDFRGTLELLARKAGIDLSQFAPKGAKPERPKAYILKALELATRFYQRQLITNRAALEYLLKKRGFSKQTLLDWQIGYAPGNRTALADFLGKNGFDMHEVKLAGLASERRDRAFDMFRGRIMIPLADSQGQVVGFTARLLKETADAPKYINTPQTLVYDKSRHIFGLHLAKEAIRKQGYTVVVEGNMDVIASHQAGVRNVVASAGTAMTEPHLRLLKRFTGDIRLCFDADRAGLEATIRSIPLAQKTGVDLSIINLKDAKDNDELIRKKGVDAWQKAIEERKYAPDWVIDQYRQSLDLTTAQGKREFSDAVLAVVRRLQDALEQEHYLKIVAEVTQSSLEAVKAKFERVSASTTITPRRRPKDIPALDLAAAEYQKLQDHFLAMTFFAPKIRYLLDDCKPQYFSDGSSRLVFDFLKKNPDFRGKTLPKPLQPAADYVKILTLQFEELYQSLPSDDLAEQAAGLKQRLIEKYVKIAKTRLASLMHQTDDEKKLDKYLKKVNQLNQLIK